MRALVLSLMLGAATLAALEERAQKEWRHHEYAAACIDFQKLAWIDAKQAPTHWLELGQCQAKVGKKKDAIASVRRAIRTGDAPTRLRAYAALARLDVKLEVPAVKRPVGAEPESGDCVTVLEDGECGPLVSCRYVNDTGEDTYEVGVAFASSADKLDPQAVGAEELASDAWSDTEHGLAGVKIASAGPDGGTLRRCALVAANACNGRLGVVCDGKPAELSLQVAPDAGLR
jgi:hypothetical protein